MQYIVLSLEENIRIYLEVNDNEQSIQQKLWDTVKFVGETMETVTDFIFLGSKMIVDGDCSHEIKRYLPLGRKAMTNLDSIAETLLC